jgi:hypothetical protein
MTKLTHEVLSRLMGAVPVAACDHPLDDGPSSVALDGRLRPHPVFSFRCARCGVTIELDERADGVVSPREAVHAWN